MCKDKSGARNGVHKCQKGHKVPEGIPFTTMTAKQAQEASVRARNLRKQVRAQMLDTLVNGMDFGTEMLKAVKSGDSDKIEIIETALRIVGLTHNQSEEAVQKIAVDAKTENKTELVGQVDFVVKK